MIIERKYKVEIRDVINDRSLSNKALLRFMENIGCMHSDIVGYGINSVSVTNFIWILLDWKVEILSKAMYGDELTVRTWSRGMEKCYAYRDFEVLNTNGDKIAVATSRWVLVDYKKHKIIKIADEVRNAYPTENRSSFGNFLFNKIEVPKEFDSHVEYKIRKADLDLNNHVNNLNYLDIAYEALPNNIDACNAYSNIRISYKKEIKYGDTVKAFYTENDGKSIVVIKNSDETVTHSIIELW